MKVCVMNLEENNMLHFATGETINECLFDYVHNVWEWAASYVNDDIASGVVKAVQTSGTTWDGFVEGDLVLKIAKIKE